MIVPGGTTFGPKKLFNSAIADIWIELNCRNGTTFGEYRAQPSIVQAFMLNLKSREFKVRRDAQTFRKLALVSWSIFCSF